MKHEKDTQLLSIAFALIVISVALVMLALSTLTGMAQVDDGYPAPIDYGYPIGYPIDEGYPIYDPYPVTGYPVIEPYPVEYGYPVDVGYPMDTGYPTIGYPIDPLYPEPAGYPVEVVSEPTFAEEWQAVTSEPQLEVEPVQYEPPSPYRNGRNLWQEIVYQFAKLLALMK